MSPTDFLITYLAVGAAFAMRAYFRNRRLPSLHLAGSVVAELIFGLPLSVFRLGKNVGLKARNSRSAAGPTSGPDFSDAIDAVVGPITDKMFRRLLSDALERYVALHLAVSAVPDRIDGEFELFSISGHLNGRTGTQCLARRNSAKLLLQKRRTVEDIRGLVTAPDRSGHARTDLSESLTGFFLEFDDDDAVSALAFHSYPPVDRSGTAAPTIVSTR